MIVRFNSKCGETEGCGCCSDLLTTKTNKREILEQAKGNIEIVKDICRHYKISFEDFIK